MNYSDKTRIKNESSTGRNVFFRKPENADIFFQPKLQVGPVDDVYEREADAIADKVVNGGDVAVQRSLAVTHLQSKCSHCEEEEKAQRKPKQPSTNGEAPSIVADALSGSGSSMDAGTKSFMEGRFGCDFSGVKIHTGSLAAQSAQSINALAYTSGSNIVFNEGQYDPSSNSGKKLLAHELTHVLQQGGSEVKRVIIDEGKPNPMQPGAYDHLGPEECDDGEVNDDRVRELIHEALSLYDGMDPHARADMAWSYLFQEREKNCCDYDYAAAEHYMYARKEVANGFPAWLMKIYAYGYKLLKSLVPQAAGCPKTQPNADVRDWGLAGAEAGLNDRP